MFLKVGFAALPANPRRNGVQQHMTALAVDVKRGRALSHFALAVNTFHRLQSNCYYTESGEKQPSHRFLSPLFALKQPLDVPRRVDNTNHFDAVVKRVVEDDVAFGHKDAQANPEVVAQFAHERLSGQQGKLLVKPL
jgi:hypothetical protein